LFTRSIFAMRRSASWKASAPISCRDSSRPAVGARSTPPI
jgi:hypothetical protein